MKKEYSYILSCESTVDLPYSYMETRSVPVLFYSYTVEGAEYFDNMGRDPKVLGEFYRFLDRGKIPTTSQINYYRYYDFFEELLKKGDVLHLAFGSGMTPSVNNAQSAAKDLSIKYPERKIAVIDTLCSSGGYGLMVDKAADLRDKGATFEETAGWVESNAHKVHHQFFSTEMKYLRKSGRVSGAEATVATILGICPIMRLDYWGHIKAYGKVRGKQNAIKTTVNEMLKYAENGKKYNGKCIICHSDCLEDAKLTEKEIKKAFSGVKDIKISDIGSVIASHCGAGTVAVFFFGNDRPAE